MKKPARLEKNQGGGGWSGAPQAPFANTVLASWAWKRLICFEATLPGLKRAEGLLGGGGRNPPPQTCKAPPIFKHMLASWVWTGFRRGVGKGVGGCRGVWGLRGCREFRGYRGRTGHGGVGVVVRGLGGLGVPPPIANTMLASWSKGVKFGSFGCSSFSSHGDLSCDVRRLKS